MKIKTNKQYKRELTQAAVGGALLAAIGVLAYKGLEKAFKSISASVKEVANDETEQPVEETGESATEEVAKVEEQVSAEEAEQLTIPANSHKRRKAA